MSYICMDGCMHCLVNSLKKLLHWYWSWTSTLLHFLEQRLSSFKRLTSSTTTACLWGRGGICMSICPPVLQEWESIRAHCFIYSLQGSGTLAKAEPQFFTLMSDFWQPVLFLTHRCVCSLINVVMTSGVSRKPNLWDAVLPLKESSLKKITLWKGILIVSFLGNDLREAF